ncbi:hypothetical protein ACFV7Q_22115 [Streptomyces sp. NPDC059851]|uniref:hypothetical protein n=1 Tax=Streptomyces sp. NPDC059851 TaxID=3346971 RepID=UPI00365291B1
MAKHSTGAAAAAAALDCVTARGPARSVAAPPPARDARPGPTAAAARCGLLEVPEDRARPSDRTVKLAVAVVPAAAVKPADSGNLHDQPNPAYPQPVRFHAQYVGLRHNGAPAQRLPLDVVQKCRDRLAADGIDLSTHHTTGTAADFGVRSASGRPGTRRPTCWTRGAGPFPGWPDDDLARAPHLPSPYDVCRTRNVPDRSAARRVATASADPTAPDAGCTAGPAPKPFTVTPK